jgi:hypothetical protein
LKNRPACVTTGRPCTKAVEVAHRTACLRLAASLLAGALIAAAPGPRVNPQAPRFAIAGIVPGMKIGPAVAAMHAAFADEGLTNLQPVQSASNRSPNADVVRLSFGQSASAVSPDFRSDRFRLLLAGPADDLRVTGVSRDYLAPTGLDRATVLRNLIHRYGPPSSSIVPDAAVAPDTAQLEWLIRPNGARGGDGSQGSESLQCNAGMSSYEDYFAHAASGEEAQLLALLQQQQKAGCGLVLLIGFGGNVVHYALYDTGAAMAALSGSKAAREEAAARKPANTAGIEAAGAIQY